MCHNDRDTEVCVERRGKTVIGREKQFYASRNIPMTVTGRIVFRGQYRFYPRVLHKRQCHDHCGTLVTHRLSFPGQNCAWVRILKRKKDTNKVSSVWSLGDTYLVVPDGRALQLIQLSDFGEGVSTLIHSWVLLTEPAEIRNLNQPQCPSIRYNKVRITKTPK